MRASVIFLAAAAWATPVIHPRLAYARLGIFSREDALNRSSRFEYAATMESSDPPFGGLCQWKFLDGYYCDGNVNYLCHCSYKDFPIPNCRTVWHTSCPEGCAGNHCKDPLATCADGWVDDPLCADLELSEEDLEDCQAYFGTGEMCQLRKREGSVYFAHSKSRIREEALKTLRFFKGARLAYERIFQSREETDFMVIVDGYMKRTERNFACERAFPRCHDDRYEGYQCDALRQDHNENIQALELTCRRQGAECEEAVLLPKTVCNKSNAHRGHPSLSVAVVVWFVLLHLNN